MMCQKNIQIKKVQRIGNSLFVSISPSQARELEIRAGDEVRIKQIDETLIITKWEKGR